MFDEIAVKHQPCWDDHTNHLAGICRKHSQSLGLEFCTLEEVEVLHKAIGNREVHLASEVCPLESWSSTAHSNSPQAMIAAIGLLSGNTHIYMLRPVLIPGTCK